MSKKKSKLIKHFIDDMPVSGPAPDYGLTTVGLDMHWHPDDSKPIKKKEVDKDIDPMLSIL